MHYRVTENICIRCIQWAGYTFDVGKVHESLRMRRVISAHALQTAARSTRRRDTFCRRTAKRGDQGMSTVSSLEEGLTKPKGAVLFTGRFLLLLYVRNARSRSGKK